MISVKMRMFGRYNNIVIALLIFLSPLKFSIISLGGFQVYPYYFLVLFVLIGFVINPSRRYILTNIQRALWLYNIIVLIFVAIAIFFGSRYIHEAYGVGVISMMTLIVSVYLMQVLYSTNNSYLSLIKYASIFCVLISCCAIIEYIANIHFHDSYYLSLVNKGYHLHYADLTYGNPNGLAQILLVLYPFVLCSTKRQSPVKVLLSLFLVEVAILITYSRLSIIAMIFLLVICLFASDRWIKKIAAINLVFVIVTLIICVLFYHNHLSAKLSSLYSGHDNSSHERMLLLFNGIQMFIDQPLGAGIYGFQEHMLAHRGGHISIIDPHNYFLNVAVDYGLLGITALFIFLFLVYRSAYLGRYIEKRVSLLIRLSIVAFVFTSSNSSSTFRVLWLIWYIPAIAMLTDAVFFRRKAIFATGEIINSGQER